jgi:hypothetical protein
MRYQEIRYAPRIDKKQDEAIDKVRACKTSLKVARVAQILFWISSDIAWYLVFQGIHPIAHLGCCAANLGTLLIKPLLPSRIELPRVSVGDAIYSFDRCGKQLFSLIVDIALAPLKFSFQIYTAFYQPHALQSIRYF